MSSPAGSKAFTVRLPKDLVDQIDARALVNKRRRNAEIHWLLERAIDKSVKTDLDLFSKPEGSIQTE
jgi:predicted transcriptional regulator